jgi:GSCFA family
MPDTTSGEQIAPNSFAEQSLYIASATEVSNNWRDNSANQWYNDGADPADAAGPYAFQRLGQTWFTPKISPKFKLRHDDKFYAIGSCFARGLEYALRRCKMSVESAAPEFARLVPVNKERTGIGFINKYNTFSILNELRWALDPAAVFPVESIAKVTETTWSDPHANPTLELVGFEQTLKRRALLQEVTKRIVNCRSVVITLGLAEVWRDVKANVYLNSTPIPPLLEREPERYELHLTSFAQNLANLEAIHALLSRYGHPDLRIVATVSPVPLHATFLRMDVVLATTYAKSVLRAAAQQWAISHENVDYFPSYEIVQNSDRAAVWEPDRIHVTVAGLQHIIGLFLQSYLEEDSQERSFSREIHSACTSISAVGVAD